MKQKMISQKKKIAMVTMLLLFVSLLFVNVRNAAALKNVGALDTGIVACAGGGDLDCRGFAAQVIIWIP